MTETPTLRIGQLAERVGVSAKAIRYYEQLGLLPEPERTSAGYRLYRAADAERLRFIVRGRQIGFSLGEIKEIFALRDRDEVPCQYVTEVLERRHGDLARQVAELEQLNAQLAKLLGTARRLGPRPTPPGGYCHILES
jgi:DNA-binding transcriptional MerR regulator